jgi:hypothetical protein
LPAGFSGATLWSNVSAFPYRSNRSCSVRSLRSQSRSACTTTRDGASSARCCSSSPSRCSLRALRRVRSSPFGWVRWYNFSIGIKPLQPSSRQNRSARIGLDRIGSYRIVADLPRRDRIEECTGPLRCTAISARCSSQWPSCECDTFTVSRLFYATVRQCDRTTAQQRDCAAVRLSHRATVACADRSLTHRRPQYWEIYRLKEVVGISLTFMAVDILGGIFSFLSLFFRDSLDVAAFVSISAALMNRLVSPLHPSPPSAFPPFALRPSPFALHPTPPHSHSGLWVRPY